MNVLVTGGAGFIGSHIVDKLIEREHEVAIIDNLCHGSRENINPKAKFFEVDITDSKVEDIFRKEKPNYVIHQAAQADVTDSVKNPVFDAQINILGAINLLECCRKFEVEKIVYASSGGAIYGEPKYLPLDEKHPIAPISPYGASKYTVEIYLNLYAELYHLNYTSLRYANVYGPRQDPYGEGGVIAIFSNKLLKDERPTIYGDGKQTRDFVYVSDVADANIVAMKGGDNEAFNIGTGKETSVNELFELLRDIGGKKIEPIYGVERKGEVKRSYVTYSKAKRGLHWQPEVTLSDGLKKTVEHFKCIRG